MMETKLASIANRAKQHPKETFTALYHHLNEELLLECNQELAGNKATGIDGVTKKIYEEKLTEHLRDLVGRLKNLLTFPVGRFFCYPDDLSARD